MTANLRTLSHGDKGHIISVCAEGETAQRMREMGLVSGAEIEMMTRAPLRDPVALRVGGVTLALRNGEADAVTVEVRS